MGHHPPTGTQQVVDVATSGGLSPLTWILISIGIVVVVYLIYKGLTKR